MKKYFLVSALFFFSFLSTADSRMEKFDSNNDGKISPEEIKAQGCSLNMSLFKVADKDGDGFLNIREARKGKKTAFRGC